MQRILALDISSSTIGWALIVKNKDSIDIDQFGHIKPPKKDGDSLSARIEKLHPLIDSLIKKTKPDHIAVEDYAKSFTKGRSSAQTIIVLSFFNETVSWIAYRALKKDVTRYAVSSIRSKLSKYFKYKIVSKEDIFPAIAVFSSMQNKPIITINRNGKIHKENLDVADAIAVGLAHALSVEN